MLIEGRLTMYVPPIQSWAVGSGNFLYCSWTKVLKLAIGIDEISLRAGFCFVV